MSGTVFLREFDNGLVTTIGAKLVDVSVDGSTRQEYAIDFAEFPVGDLIQQFDVQGPPQYGGKVPVFFVVGSAPYTPRYYPCIVVRRNSFDPAMQRHTPWSIDYKKPSVGSVVKSVTLSNGDVVSGPSHLEIKPGAYDYDLNYEVSPRARGDGAHQCAETMFKALARIMQPPGFAMTLTDTAGDERGYDVVLEGISPNIEVLDLTAREVGWIFSVRVLGELDQIEPYDVVTLSSEPQTTLSKL